MERAFRLTRIGIILNLCILMFGIQLCKPVQAAVLDSGIAVQYSVVNNHMNVTIKGRMNTSNATWLTGYILRPNTPPYTLSSITANTGKAVVGAVIQKQVSGEFVLSNIMVKNAVPGWYEVYLCADKETPVLVRFLYPTVDILNQFYIDAAQADDVGTLVQKYLVDIPVLNTQSLKLYEYYGQVKNAADTFYKALQPAAFVSVNEVENVIEKAIAMALLNGSDDKSALSAVVSELGVDSAAYNAVVSQSDSLQMLYDLFYSMIQNAKLQGAVSEISTAQNILNTAIAVTQINFATADTIIGMIEANAGFLGLNLTGNYTRVSHASVGSALIGQNFTTANAVQAAFNQKIAELMQSFVLDSKIGVRSSAQNNNLNITIKGKLKTDNKTWLTGYILRPNQPSYTLGDINQQTGKAVLGAVIQKQVNGDFLISNVMVKNALTGRYQIYLCAQNETPLKLEFINPTSDELSQFCAAAARASSISGLLQQYATVDMPLMNENNIRLYDYYSQVHSMADTFYQSVKPSAYTSIVAVEGVIEKSIAMALVNSTSDQNVLISTVPIFGMDSAIYQTLISKTYSLQTLKQTIYNLVQQEKAAGGAKTIDNVQNIIKRAIIFTQIRYATDEVMVGLTGQTIVGIMEANADFLGLNLTGNYTKVDHIELGKALAGQSFSTIQQVQDAFNQRIAELMKTPDYSLNKGGNGGSSAVSVTAPQSAAIQPIASTDAGNQAAKINADKDIFNDIADVPWAWEALTALSKKGVISGVGDGNFGPEMDITREQFLTIMVKAFGILTEGEDVWFNDADPEAWYYPYIKAGVNSKMISGLGDGNFGIGQSIKRRDLAVMMYRLSDYLGIPLSAIRPAAPFNDIPEDDYAYTAVSALQSAGILNGTGANHYSPEESVTRVQAAKAVYNLLCLTPDGLQGIDTASATTATKTVERPVYYFLGSSTTAGDGNGGVSFVDYLAESGSRICKKDGLGGTTMAGTGDNCFIPRMLRNLMSSEHIDQFFCQVSGNDFSQSLPTGKISDSKELGDFDTSTSIGAMEYIIAYAKKTWNCKVTFFVGLHTDTGYGDMIEAAYQVQKKWGIDIVDCYNYKIVRGDKIETMEVLADATLQTYIATDRIHPNEAGNRWMAKMFSKYLTDTNGGDDSE